MESKYFDKWKKLREEGKNLYQLRNNNILVEVLPEEETVSKGGIVLATAGKKFVEEGAQGLACVVLDVGQGYWDAENDKYIPLEVQPGNIVLLPKFSVQIFKAFPGFPEYTEMKLGFTLEGEVKLLYKDYKSYEEAKNILKEA